MSEIKQVQLCEIEILQEIDCICKKHNLEYFAIGGTALGAVRHEGFIPWDDDIDIGMARSDYEKFLKIASKELPDEYHIQNIFTESKSPFYFTKIRKNKTKFVEYYLRDYPIHHGIFVDIFPFDAIPDNRIVEKIHFRIVRMLYQLFLAKSLDTVCSSFLEQKGDFQKTYKHYVRKMLHALLRPVPKKVLFWSLDKCSRMFNKKDTKRIGHVSRKRLMVDKEVLYPICCLSFDGFMMPVPNDYDAYLESQFGDYWSLPPEEKRYGHLPYLVEFADGGNKE